MWGCPPKRHWELLLRLLSHSRPTVSLLFLLLVSNKAYSEFFLSLTLSFLSNTEQ